METDGKTVSRWKRATLMLSDRQLFGGMCEPMRILLQASRHCRPGRDEKRSWNTGGSSGHRARANAKIEQVAGPGKYHGHISDIVINRGSDTNTHIHTHSSLEGRHYKPAVIVLLNNAVHWIVSRDFLLYIYLIHKYKDKERLEVTRMLLSQSETQDVMLNPFGTCVNLFPIAEKIRLHREIRLQMEIREWVHMHSARVLHATCQIFDLCNVLIHCSTAQTHLKRISFRSIEFGKKICCTAPGNVSILHF